MEYRYEDGTIGAELKQIAKDMERNIDAVYALNADHPSRCRNLSLAATEAETALFRVNQAMRELGHDVMTQRR